MATPEKWETGPSGCQLLQGSPKEGRKEYRFEVPSPLLSAHRILPPRTRAMNPGKQGLNPQKLSERKTLLLHAALFAYSDSGKEWSQKAQEGCSLLCFVDVDLFSQRL